MAARVDSGDNLRVRCPRCGNEGEVPRSAAGQIWGCTSCKKWVYIDRHGKAYARIRPPDPQLVSITVDVRCPRCGTRRKVSPRQLEGLLVCSSCGERLWVAPDGRLLSGPRAFAEYRRARGDASRPEGQGGLRRVSLPSVPLLPGRFVPFAVGALLLAVLFVFVSRIQTTRSAGRDAPERVAREFVAAFLRGEKEKATAYVGSGESEAFDRWWLLQRAGLEAAFGESVVGEVTDTVVERSSGDSAQVRVLVRIRGRELQYILSLERRGDTWVIRFGSAEEEQASLQGVQRRSHRAQLRAA